MKQCAYIRNIRWSPSLNEQSKKREIIEIISLFKNILRCIKMWCDWKQDQAKCAHRRVWHMVLHWPFNICSLFQFVFLMGHSYLFFSVYVFIIMLIRHLMPEKSQNLIAGLIKWKHKCIMGQYGTLWGNIVLLCTQLVVTLPSNPFSLCFKLCP